MIGETSRYYRLEIKTYKTSDNREIAYKARRFPPQGEKMPLMLETDVNQGDRLDQITHRTLGDPEHFWRICDANNARNPFELTDVPGRKLRVPVPGFE